MNGLTRVWKPCLIGLAIILTGCATAVPTAAPTPAATSTATPSATATVAVVPLLPQSGEIEPGTYAYAGPPIPGITQVTLTIASGWTADRGAFVLKSNALPPSGLGLGLWVVKQIYTEPCRWMRATLEPPTGWTSATLADALVTHRGSTPPVDASVAGYTGKRLELKVPDDVDFADCDQGEFRSWTDARVASGRRFHQGPGQIDEVYLVDVGETVLVIGGTYFPGSASGDVAELRQMIESVEIEDAGE